MQENSIYIKYQLFCQGENSCLMPSVAMKELGSGLKTGNLEQKVSAWIVKDRNNYKAG